MLVDDNPQRATMVEERLWAAGFDVILVIPSAAGLLFQIEQNRPDVVLMDLESPDRDVLESLAIINHHNPTPVVMFTQQDDPDYIREAVTAGISTYLVGDINPDQVKPIIDVAMAQFRAFQGLREELLSTRAQLDDRKLIEQAKGLLMSHKKISEDEAHRLLTKLAMDTNQRLPAVAKTVLATLSLQGKRKD
ncbi:MAG: chemotaxis protein CheY [Gammaproteobacteria bacterium BRH_c0]|nr:MAG: chemotaxis protein CheY [Gammaproteobacteria bacterium BRH_c0]